MYIAFNDKRPFKCIAAYASSQFVTSLKDVESGDSRDILSIHFDPNIVTTSMLEDYFVNADEKTSVITIVDDSGNPFVHTDYCIPLRLAVEYNGDNPNLMTVMELAKLTEKDKVLRKAIGKQKVYAGTPLEIEIAKKIDELDDTCTEIIHGGFNIPLPSGTVEHFNFDDQDQANITGIAVEICLGAQHIFWHNSDQDKPCRIYTPEEMTIIVTILSLHKKFNITYFRDLRRYIKSLENEEEVRRAYYGLALPEEFQSEALKIIIGDMGDVIYQLELALFPEPPHYDELDKAVEDQKNESTGNIDDYINQDNTENTEPKDEDSDSKDETPSEEPNESPSTSDNTDKKSSDETDKIDEKTSEENDNNNDKTKSDTPVEIFPVDEGDITK